MAKKHCPNCNASISAGSFFSSVAGATGSFRCKQCAHTLKKDISLSTGLFYFTLMAIFLPVAIIFGFGRAPGGHPVQRIQQIFSVNSDTAFLIGIGTITTMLVSVYVVGYLVFKGLKFEK